MDTVYEIETIKVRLKVAEPTTKKLDDPFFTAAYLAALIYKDLDADQEHFSMVSLDQKLHIRGYKVIFSGGQASSIIDLSVLFRTALLMGAKRMIIVHNHPAGDPSPSPEDATLTDRIKEGAKLLQIELVDHIILGEKKYFSFSEMKILDDPISGAPTGNKARGRKKLSVPGRQRTL